MMLWQKINSSLHPSTHRHGTVHIGHDECPSVLPSSITDPPIKLRTVLFQILQNFEMEKNINPIHPRVASTNINHLIDSIDLRYIINNEKSKNKQKRNSLLSF